MSTSQKLKVGLDLRSKVPITLQIVEAIKTAVASGALEPGDQLPTVRQMAADLRVNFNTVARAYRMLDEAGVISTQHGRGTYVLERIPAEGGRRARVAALDNLTQSYLAAAQRLGYSPDEVERRVDVLLARWRRSGGVSGE
ncbi:MAG: GntR family transcriptional regulator [Anaerolineales bacterium]